MKKKNVSGDVIISDAIEQNQYLKMIMNTLSDLIWLKDVNGVYLYCNHEFERFFGACEADIIGKTDFDFVDREAAIQFQLNDTNTLALNQPMVNEEWVSYASDNKKVYLKTTKSPLYGIDGGLIGVLGTGVDITYLKTAQEGLRSVNTELNKLVSIDALTNIGNRRSFDECYAREWRVCQREKTSLSLVFIDVDYFKKYNDIYGHANGDKCLQRIGALLRSGGYARRPNDLVARYGGEEFVVVLSQASSSDAFEIAEKLRESVLALTIPHKASGVEGIDPKVVTISVGIASIVPSVKDRHEDFFIKVDEALYRAKGRGRNQCAL